MRRGKRKAVFHLDIAPVNLIDLLLVLLIFFVTTTTFLQLKVIELNVPKAKSAQVQYTKDLTHVINVKQNCDIFFDSKAMNSKQLSLAIKQKFEKNKKSIFQIGADENSPHKCFVEVLDILRQEGIENIAILTKEKK